MKTKTLPALGVVWWMACATACPEPTPAGDGGNGVDARVGWDVQGTDAVGHDANRPDAGDLPNLALGTWQIENVSNTTGTISHDGALAFTGDGTLWVAWSEPLATESGDQDIWTGARGGSGWTNAPLTNDVGVQNAFPRLAASGDAVFLVFNGYPGGDNDVFAASAEVGEVISGHFDLTSPSEASGTRRDYHPELAISPTGEFAVTYLSAPVNSSGEEIGPADVRVLRFDEPTAPEEPLTAIATPANEYCDDLGLAFDGQGHLHLVASCGPLLQGTVRYVTDRSGSWVATPIPAGSTTTGYSCQIASDPDGATLHVVWIGEWTCGNDHCSDVMYTRIAGGTPAAPVRATSTDSSDDNERVPVMAVDAGGRVLVAFQRSDAGGDFDIFFAWSADGVAWSAPHNITDSVGVDEWMPYSLVLDPIKQLPHLSFTKILSGTDPLDTEVMHAWLEP
ncbi:MAG: hypothetical protein JXR83_20285 [Deltaproteobacteria bacterium]|nr:hypothetical protein [Deltaproteobacteria bacterium]